MNVMNYLTGNGVVPSVERASGDQTEASFINERCSLGVKEDFSICFMIWLLLLVGLDIVYIVLNIYNIGWADAVLDTINAVVILILLLYVTLGFSKLRKYNSPSRPILI